MRFYKNSLLSQTSIQLIKGALQHFSSIVRKHRQLVVEDSENTQAKHYGVVGGLEFTIHSQGQLEIVPCFFYIPCLKLLRHKPLRHKPKFTAIGGFEHCELYCDCCRCERPPRACACANVHTKSTPLVRIKKECPKS